MVNNLNFNKLTEALKNKIPMPNNIPHTVLQKPVLQPIGTPSVLTKERFVNSFIFTRVLREIFYRNFMKYFIEISWSSVCTMLLYRFCCLLQLEVQHIDPC
jgi:hypothetical protein